MAKCFLFNWKALSFLSPLLVFHSGHDPGVEIERNTNRMQKVSVKKHQSCRSLLSLLPTPLLSCLDHLVSSRLPMPFSFPAIPAWCLSIPSLFLYLPFHHTFWNHVTMGFPQPPQKGDFHLEKVFTQRQLSCCTRKQRHCLARRRGETSESLTSLARPVSAWVHHGFAAQQTAIADIFSAARHSIPAKVTVWQKRWWAGMAACTNPVTSQQSVLTGVQPLAKERHESRRNDSGGCTDCCLCPLFSARCVVVSGPCRCCPKSGRSCWTVCADEAWDPRGCRSSSCRLCLGPSVSPSVISLIGRQKPNMHWGGGGGEIESLARFALSPVWWMPQR